MQQTFSSNRFRNAVSTFSRLESSLLPFEVECQKCNMSWMLGILQELYDYLHQSSISINLTFNSMFALKHLINSGNIVFINLVEIYLLPKLEKIAVFDFSTVNQRRGFSYFIDKGYQGKRTELQQYGNSFIRMANQLIIACSHIKPRMLLQSQELTEPSEFVIALRKLQKRGFDPHNYPKFYRMQEIGQVRQLFKKNLSHFANVSEKVATFYATTVLHYLRGQPDPARTRHELHPNKVFKAGDVTICKKVLRDCFASFLSSDLMERKRALSVINSFALWGDILVAYAINVIGVMDEAVQEIANPHVRQTDSIRAQFVLEKYKNTKQEKVNYYSDLLKSIKFFAMCFPYSFDSSKRPSQIHQAYLLLEQKLDIQFPEFMIDVKENYAIFAFNFKNKQTRNNRLIQLFYQNAKKGQKPPTRSPTLMGPGQTSSRKSFLDRQMSYHDLFDDFASVSSFEIFKEQLSKIKQILQDMCVDKSVVKQSSVILKQFVEEFDTKIVEGRFNENELTYLINQGAPLIERIEDIMPAIDKYLKGSMSYPQLRSFISGYKEQKHEQKIQDIKMKKKESALKSLSSFEKTAQKQISMEQTPRVIIPYTESHEAWGGPEFFQMKPRFQELNKLQTYARELIGINESRLLNTKKQGPDLVALKKIPNLQSNSEAFASASSVDRAKPMINAKDIPFLESKGDEFVQIPRMTSLESKMMESKGPAEMEKSKSPNALSPNALSPNPNDQTYLKQRRNSQQVVEKYGEGILKISQRCDEEEIESPHRRNNKKSQGWSSMNSDVFCNVASNGNSKQNIQDSKSVHQKLDRFMELSSCNIFPDSVGLHQILDENSFQFSRFSPKETNYIKKTHGKEEHLRGKNVASSKNKVSFSRTGSHVLEYSESNKAKESSTMNRINMLSGKQKKQSEPQVYVTTPQNQVLTHRKSRTMEISSKEEIQAPGKTSIYLNNSKQLKLESEPQQIEQVAKRQQILKCLSPKNQDKKSPRPLGSPQSADDSKEHYFRAKLKQSTLQGYSDKRSNSPKPTEYGRQVFLQRGFYKQKQKVTESSESASRLSETKEPINGQNIYTKI